MKLWIILKKFLSLSNEKLQMYESVTNNTTRGNKTH